MKMKLGIIYLFFGFALLILTNSCNNVNRRIKDEKVKTPIEFMIEDQNRHYNELISRIDKKLTQHFPEVLDTNNIEVSGVPKDRVDLFMLEVTNKISEEGIDQKFAEESIAIYSGDDPCLLSFGRFESWKKYPQSRFRQCLVDKYPIPDFKRNKFSDVSTESKLSSDFEIYVLESEPHNTLSDTIIINNDLLLKKWKSGFSRGVAISVEKMVIIYWLIVW